MIERRGLTERDAAAVRCRTKHRENAQSTRTAAFRGVKQKYYYSLADEGCGRVEKSRIFIMGQKSGAVTMTRHRA